MRFELVPLLAKVRELYAMPRDMARFRAYLEAMLTDAKDGVVYPPMVSLNPMGREHVLAAVEALLAMDAERIAAEALREAQARLPAGGPAFKVGLTVLDDVRGGWTHTELLEAGMFFPEKVPAKLTTPWITVPTWTKRIPDARDVREETLAAAARAAHVAQHGLTRTLADMMRQEALAQSFAGRRPTLDAAALDAARPLLAQHAGATVFATRFAAMYGDRAAKEAGHKPLGLPERAGFEVAMADPRAWGLP